MPDHRLDVQREARIGLAEAVLAAPKTPAQIDAIVRTAQARGLRLLLTRLLPAQHLALDPSVRAVLDYDPLSATAVLGVPVETTTAARIAIVTGGTSDLRVAAEAARTLAFHGQRSETIADVGVAGLWRLLEQKERIEAFRVVIAIAGMEGALFSVLGGLVGAVIIAVPTSTGYGVTEGGHAALTSALGSCAPGLLTVNIDNGHGAALAALRVLHQLDRPTV